MSICVICVPFDNQPQNPFIKQEYIALWLAMILLAAQQDLGVIADMLSILVNLFHLRQIVTSWRADDA